MDPNETSQHHPVLAREVIALLDPRPGAVCVDCTVGLGGHAALLAERVGPGGIVIGMDVDPRNLAIAKERLADAPADIRLFEGNFALLPDALRQAGVEHVDALLADLGFSSNQMADPARGLSFDSDGPLDMRLDPSLQQTAADLVNDLPVDELANVLYRYGEERLSRKIARKIDEARQQTPILDCKSLATLVRRAYPPRNPRSPRKSQGKAQGKIDPATRTFMALRIAVNGELEALEQLLGHLPTVLGPGGRAAIISFHSLEDRLVKQALVRFDRDGVAKRITRKPVVAEAGEQRDNPRSRSAKLRVMQRLASSATDAEA
jgi:16S rRNA (cytosine1402-N4)-methyltransferase